MSHNPSWGEPRQASPVDGIKDRRNRPFLAVLLMIGTAYVILFGYYFAAVMIRRPYLDMFHYIMDYLDYSRMGGFFDYLWSRYSNSEHRQIWMRLLTAIDVGIFRGVAYPFLIVDTIAVVAVPLLIGREIARSGLPRSLGATAIWAVTMLTLTTANVADCSIPIEGIYPQTVVFVVLSLILYEGPSQRGRSATPHRLGAIAAGVGAGFASAVGLLVWPILVWTAWRGSLGWRWIAAAAIVGGAFIAVYIHGQTHFGSRAAMTDDHQFYSLTNILRVGNALITFLGLPWTRAPALAIVGRVLGAGLLLIGILALVRRGAGGPRHDRLERIALGLIMFSLTTAAFAALGRGGPQWQGIWPVRYALFLVPLHAGLVCLALPWLKSRWETPGGRRAIQAAALSFGALMLVQQVAAGQSGARESQALNAAIAEFMATGREPSNPQVLWGNLARTQQVVDEMRRQQLYLDVH